jgi:hypothetical protein
MPSPSLMWTMMKYGFKNYASVIARHVHFKVDIYLVALYLTNADIELY